MCLDSFLSENVKRENINLVFSKVFKKSKNYLKKIKNKKENKIT